ncbi:IniB N-terminal domain-containing protein [[Micrococcus luteus] ATCC 49442]|jgi:hypothetical protein|uniref:IniB N-terminal domain-containing protein n=1 Tax=[Micrococcus luteus] ATCC 49442 TaxID=2698727 RepID=UPI0013DBBF6E|nr:IniB N-terminal domain-containing protein [[Micrococcus luteus] ATCC 49442]
MPTLANDLVLFLMSLFGNEEAAKEFLDDPEKVLEEHGLDKVCSADVDAAMPVILDFAPITVNASSFDREYNTGGNDSEVSGGGHTPPPAGGGRDHDHDHDHGDHDHDDHAHAVQQLHHVVNNYSYTSTVDDRDTITDQSVNQNIWADGDVTQWFDNDSVVASGDRAVAAGDDVDIEDSNNIEDSYNTDNSHDDSTDNSIRAGGDVNIGNEETDIEDSFNTDLDVDIEESFNDNSDNSTNDSNNNNSDNSDNSDNSSETDIDVDIEDSLNDNSDNRVDNSEETTDSYNDESIEVDVEDVGNTEYNLENVANTENDLENFNNTTTTDESVTVGDIDYTDVNVEDNTLEFTEDNSDNSINTDVDIEDNVLVVDSLNDNEID